MSSESIGDILDTLTLYLAAREHERHVSALYVDSLRPGRAASPEVKQAGSDALLAARQRAHALYRRLHLAATGVEAARYGREQVDPGAARASAQATENQA
jgi:hypothetical protein